MDTTGVFQIPQSMLIDRELRCQHGVSLRAWAETHDIPLGMLMGGIDGIMTGLDDALAELADTLGVTVKALCGGQLRTGS